MNEMTENCYDIGTIQAFLDGELDNERLAQIAHHVAACESCALLLADAESESAFAFAALDSELNSLVPTERIRANLYEQIAAEKKPFWKKIFGENFSFFSPSVAAFASLLLVVGIFVTLFIVRENRVAPNSEIAQVEKNPTVKVPTVSDSQTSTQTKSVDDNPAVLNAAPRIEKVVAKPANRAVIEKADYKVQKNPAKNQTPIVENKNVENVVAQPAKTETLTGEESYIKTIATLSATVNSRKDEVLRPSARVAFEKDLAIVDDSIAKMQKEVRSNPSNEAAKELLRSSYQNKIDLLNSVADKNDFVASLK